MGGAIKAVENGFIQKEIQDAAYQYHNEIDAGTRIVVGVNRFIDAEREHIEINRVDPKLEDEQVARLKEMKAKRDNDKVKRDLSKLLSAAKGTENLLPLICEAVESYATVGEISDTLRESFGKFRPIATL